MQLERMAASLEHVWLEREALRRELSDARAEIDRLRATEHARVARAEADARATAARILAQAEEQAFDVRKRLGAEAADATARLDELLRARERLLDELAGVVTRAQTALQTQLAPSGDAPARAEAVTPIRGANGNVDRVFARAVRLDVGPFDDFAGLSSFERSLGALPTVRDVYIRSFDAPRALIDVTLGERRMLLRDLSSHVPYLLDVREATDTQIALDVDALPLASGE